MLPKINRVHCCLGDECIYVYDDSGDNVLGKIPDYIWAVGKTLHRRIKVGFEAKFHH